MARWPGPLFYDTGADVVASQFSSTVPMELSTVNYSSHLGTRIQNIEPAKNRLVTGEERSGANNSAICIKPGIDNFMNYIIRGPSLIIK